MTYGQLIAAVYGGISAQLLMLSDSTLGLLSKKALEIITGQSCGVELPAALQPISGKIEALFQRTHAGRQMILPPPWTLLLARCQLALPVYMALDDSDAGAVTRFLTEAAGGSPAPGPPGGGPQQAALKKHLGKLSAWLKEEIPAESLGIMQEITQAAEAVGEELGMEEWQKEDLKILMAAELIAGVNLTQTEDEQELVEAALLLADGEEHSEGEVRDLTRELQERCLERKKAGSDGMQGAPGGEDPGPGDGREDLEEEVLPGSEGTLDLGLPDENAVI